MINLIQQPHEIVFSKNPVFFQFSTTEASLKVKLYIETFYKSNNFVNVYSEAILADANGLVDIDVSEFVDSYLDFTMPVYEETQIIKLEKEIKRFFIQVESYDSAGDFVEDELFSNSGDYYRAVKGGINHQEYPTAGFFQNYMPTNKIFLTWTPLTANFYDGQQSFLNFMAPFDMPLTYVKFTFDYSDDTSSQPAEILALEKYDIIRIPLNQTVIDAKKTAGKTVTKITAFIEYFDTPDLIQISENRIFNIKADINRFQKNFIYFNSLSGIDTLVTSGLTESEFPVDFSVFESGLKHNYTPDQGTFKKDFISESQVFKTSTGWMSMSELDNLRELALAAKVYIIEKGQLISLIVKTKVKYNEDEDLYALEIQYSYNFNNRVYTPAQLRTITPPTYYRIINDSGDIRLIDDSNNRRVHTS